MRLTERRKPVQKALCCLISTLGHFGNGQHSGNKERRCGCRGGGRLPGAPRAQDRDTILCDIVLVDACHCALVQTHECPPPKQNRDVPCGLQLMIMYRYWLSSYDKRTTAVQGANNSGRQ